MKERKEGEEEEEDDKVEKEEEGVEEKELQEEEERRTEGTRGWSGAASCPHSWKKNNGHSFHCCFCLSLTSLPQQWRPPSP